jgi:hypothetical protein
VKQETVIEGELEGGGWGGGGVVVVLFAVKVMFRFWERLGVIEVVATVRWVMYDRRSRDLT